MNEEVEALAAKLKNLRNDITQEHVFTTFFEDATSIMIELYDAEQILKYEAFKAAMAILESQFIEEKKAITLTQGSSEVKFNIVLTRSEAEKNDASILRESETFDFSILPND